MDLRQLKYFKAVVEQGGVNRASERLHISQPAVTTALKKLEQDLDVSLFEREGRNLKITADGMKLYQHACKLLSHSQSIVFDMGRRKSQISQTINIYSPPIIAQFFLQGALNKAIKHYPDTQFNVKIGAGNNVQYELLNDDADIGFAIAPPSSARIDSVCFHREKLCVAVRKDHELANKSELKWAMLLEYGIATLPANYKLKSDLMKMSDYFNIPLQVRLETDSVSTLLSAIGHSDLIAILPISACRSSDDIVALAMPSPEDNCIIYSNVLEVYALTISKSSTKPQVHNFIDNLIDGLR